MGADESALLEVLDFGRQAAHVLLGPGDDGAVVAGARGEVVAAIDTLVDGVHVDLGLSSLADLGYKALAVNCSDLAAMAARPLGALVSLQRPGWFGRPQARELQVGLSGAAREYACPVIGGDLVSAPTLAVAVSVLGEPVREGFWLPRDGAAVGDTVVVIGALGLAGAGLELWQAGASDVLDAHPELAAAHRRPAVPLDAARALADVGASAGIDVSDGLGRDLGRLAAASGVAVELDPQRLPVAPGVARAAARLDREPLELVLGAGDDYALAATLAPERLEALQRELAADGLDARVVGEVVAGSGVRLDGADVSTLGWEHTAPEEPRADE